MNTKFYAYDGGVTTLESLGKIEISHEQYLEAIEAISNNKVVSIKDDIFELVTYDTTTVQYILDGKLLSGLKNEMPENSELYNAEEWYINGTKYCKKDADYEIYSKKQEIIKQIQAIEKKYYTPRTLAGIGVNDKIALKKRNEAEKLILPLRQKLNSL